MSIVSTSKEEEEDEEWTCSKEFVPLFSGPLPYNMYKINDEVNNQPFNFGIYEIELLINNRNIYNIIFDEYSFKNDYLIYKELDYALLSNNSRKFHRLFENHTNFF